MNFQTLIRPDFKRSFPSQRGKILSRFGNCRSLLENKPSMQVAASPQLARHPQAGDTCATTSRLARVIAFSLLASGCSPSALQAGHSLTGPEDAQSASLNEGPFDEKKTSAGKDSVDEASEAPSHPGLDAANKPGDAAPTTLPPAFVQLPPGGRLIGEAGGVAVEGLSATGHWAAICQASATASPQKNRPDMPTGLRGEATQPYELQLTWARRSEAIDALLRSDESGRYLVVLNGGRAWLLDALANTKIELSSLTPDLEGDSLPDHRAFAFSERGLVVVSARQDVDAYYLPLPLPASSNKDSPLEHALTLEFGKHPIWRIDAGKGYATAFSIGEGQTSQAWPVPKATGPVHRCQGAVPSYSAFSRLSSYRPDRDISHFWLKLPERLEKSQRLIADPAPGYIMAHQDGWVRREDSGRLVHVSKGTQKQIASERCGARILHADETTGLFVAACEDYAPVAAKPPPKNKRKSPPKYRFDLYLLRPGFVRSLSADTARTGVDVKGQFPARFVPLRPGSAAALVDLQARQLVPLDPSAYVLSSGNHHALLRDDSGLKLWSPRGTENLDYPVSSLSRVLNAGSATAVDDRLFLLGDSFSTWKLPAAPLIISSGGFALVPSEPADEARWARGPLLLLGPPEKGVALFEEPGALPKSTNVDED